MFKSIATLMAIVGVTCALPQILIPTSVSHQSGIVRNIPTTLIGIPLNGVLNDRERSTIVTQLQLEQWIQDRLNNNNPNRNVQDLINREIAAQNQQRRWNDQWNDQARSDDIIRNAEELSRRADDINRRADQLRTDDIVRRAEQLRTDDVVRRAEQLRADKIRDEFDRTETARRILNQNTGTTGLTTSDLRSTVNARLL